MDDPKIDRLNPKFADAVSQTLNEAKARKLSVGLFCGLRTAEKSQELYNRPFDGKDNDMDGKIDEPDEKVSNAKAWESWHNYGIAADIVFKDSKGNWTWDKTKEQWEELGKIGEMFGLTWGGRWKFKDYPHFQMTGLIPNVKTAKQILFDKGIEALWEMV